jgi:hypothetical protein
MPGHNVVERIRLMIKLEHCCNENGMRELQQFLTNNSVVIKFILLQEDRK